MLELIGIEQPVLAYTVNFIHRKSRTGVAIPAAPVVADVPTAITATRQTNAKVKAKELIMIFVNFVFIVVVSFCLSFVVSAVFWLPIMRGYFWPFT